MAATILVVDDEAYVRRSVERVLTRAHYDVITASDVSEAVRYAQKLPFDAAIVDYELPDSDGLQVLSRLRDLQPGCLRILMTGVQDYQMVMHAVNRGEVLRVLAKPFDPAGLLQTLQDAFDSWERAGKYLESQRKETDFQENRMLRECLENDLLRLAVQPIVDAGDSSRIVAYEALLRSLHPQLDGPLAVLRIAERHRRLGDIGQRVLALAAGWLERIPEDQRLFINLSAEQLADPSTLREHLAPIRGHASRVTLEITEQSHLRAIDRWEESVALIREQGFAIAVDDLGAGYNSLAMLADLQPAYVKLDMSLVRDVHLHDQRRRIVELITSVATAIQAKVVAEGVENASEAQALRGCGCHLLQGYHFGRPSMDLPRGMGVVAA